MDYVVGSVAALISGNVTPNRPKIRKRALTPVKHQVSPNVTPKSELTDRNVFLSPSVQKKKALVKRSPKRIFQSTDLDVTKDSEGDSDLATSKADKVKKHLEDQLKADNKIELKQNKKAKHKATSIPKANIDDVKALEDSSNVSPSKKKQKRKPLSASEVEGNGYDVENNNGIKYENEHVKSCNTLPVDCKNSLLHKLVFQHDSDTSLNTPKKEHKKSQAIILPAEYENNILITENNLDVEIFKKTPKKKKQKPEIFGSEQGTFSETEKPKALEEGNDVEFKIEDSLDLSNCRQKKNKKKKLKKYQNSSDINNLKDEKENMKQALHPQSEKDKKDSKHIVNPNAVTNKDSDSENESDGDFDSETEKVNKELLETNTVEEDSSDEEKEEQQEQKEHKERNFSERDMKEELARTIFVGNVPFSKKCKKDIKRIFSKYGIIESVRIRTVPVKDGHVTPKLAVIKNELHPDRSTVNVYVKFAQASSAVEALKENNTLINENHLRVTHSDKSGVDHDPKCSVFVGNLPFALEDETLRAIFEKCGQIDSVRIIRDKKTNAGKGFGYVNFTSKDGVELALGLPDEDLTIKNRIIRVKRCTQMTHKQISRNQQQHQNPNKNQYGEFRQMGNQNRSFKQNRNFNQNRNFQNRRQFDGNQHAPVRTDSDNGQNSGAFRRIKRKMEENSGGPPNKLASNLNQPVKEKKQRKEFVGLTAEKKKKMKSAKGQKKKKALSEILTK